MSVSTPHRIATRRSAPQRPASQRKGSISIGDYFAVVGSPYSDEDAQIAGPELRRLYEAGLSDREHIWQAASDPSSPLHNLACWDGWDASVAAEKHWRVVGSHLAASIEVEITLANGEQRRTRAFQALLDANAPEAPGDRQLKKYTPIDVIVSETDLRQQWLAAALGELRRFRNRYREIEDLLDRLPLVIDEVLAEYEEEAA